MVAIPPEESRMQRLTWNSKLLLATALFAGVVTSALGGKDGKKGKSVMDHEIELISADGEIMVEKIVTLIASCGAASDIKGVLKNTQSVLTECNFKGTFRRRRSADDLYQIACSLSCALKKLQLVSEDGKFETDEEKLKKSLQQTKAFSDGVKLKNAAAELAMCSKLIPPFNENNCYSATAWSMCGVVGVRRSCTT